MLSMGKRGRGKLAGDDRTDAGAVEIGRTDCDENPRARDHEGKKVGLAPLHKGDSVFSVRERSVKSGWSELLQ